MATLTETFPVKFDQKHYDIKPFLRDHPGGVNTLKSYKGKSIVEAMEKFGHSNSAYHILKDFKVSEGLKDVNLVGTVSANGRIVTKDDSTRNKEIQFLEELEGRLDWSKPILSQLDKITPYYEIWVNSAVYTHCRVFENPLLESLTFTPWYLVPAVWIPIILYLGYSQLMTYVYCKDSCPENTLTLIQFFGRLIFGAIIWTLMEYSMHRWVFHLNPGSSLTMMKLHFLLHGLHHKTPFDGYRQVFPPVPAMFITLAVYILVRILFNYAMIIVTGGVSGYLIYDMIHYYVHHGSPQDGSYLYEMKRYHSNHHFVNHNKAYGISNKFWDKVFNTFVHVKKLGFSLKW